MPRKNSYAPSEHVSKVLLAATRASPGIRSDALAKETALHETTVSTAGRVLIGKGLLTRVRKGRHFHYYPAGAEVAPEPQQLFLSNAPLLEAEIEALKAEIDTLEDEIDTLEAEVAELRAFKARAISQYAELDVEPIILEARKIAYLAFLDVNDRNNADCALYGNADDTPMLKAIVETLRRVKDAE